MFIVVTINEWPDAGIQCLILISVRLDTKLNNGIHSVRSSKYTILIKNERLGNTIET